MTWSGLAIWEQLRSMFALRPFRRSYTYCERLDVMGSDKWRLDDRDDAKPATYQPDERARRSEYSLHIGS